MILLIKLKSANEKLRKRDKNEHLLDIEYFTMHKTVTTYLASMVWLSGGGGDEMRAEVVQS